LLTLATSAGCHCKKRHRCTATIEYLGKPRIGKGTDFKDQAKAKEVARKDVCIEYCGEADPDVEAAYQKEKAKKKPKDLTNRPSIIANPPVQAVFNACKNKCDTALAGASFTYDCEYSGI